MLTSETIRQTFLDFFAQRGHTIVPSDSLVPKDDPTVLFTTAGMQQFKRQFLGEVTDYRRAASCQKCLRTDDLDQVGLTPYHHTFFEMLGNFSFGDYFKREAIQWAWEFLTQTLRLNPERLLVSVYEEDTEAYEIWHRQIGLEKGRIAKLGEKTNFWPSEARTKGPNGPCGPCSEIFYDYGKEHGCGRADCHVDCSCGRFAEVWNLVFTQFNRTEGGRLEPLPNKNIDTGMGLERLCAVVQGVTNNFETDLFVPIITRLREDIGSRLATPLSQRDERILADHIRAVVFAIADGVIPSNKERGAVVKKLIYNASHRLWRAGAQEPIFYTLVEAVVQKMKQPYPELEQKAPLIKEIVERAEKVFLNGLKERLPLLKKELAAIIDLSDQEKGQVLGRLMFTAHDTYGIPPELFADVVTKAWGEDAWLRHQDQAKIFFEQLLEQQRQRSRRESGLTGEVFQKESLETPLAATVFTGYDRLSDEGRVLAILDGENRIQEAHTGQTVLIVLDRTPFYAEAGGQVGDSGWMTSHRGAKVRVIDTQKKNNIYYHHGRIIEGILCAGDTITAKVDEPRRRAIMRHHTATHLLQAALRRILGEHVQQQGSLVDETRLRFDFTHPTALTQKQREDIEALVQEWIMACQPVLKEEMPLDEARRKGALAFFAEKYGDIVRVVSIGQCSIELCGGTHCNNTGEIGPFVIVSEAAVAQGIRRIEAKAGGAAQSYLTALRRTLDYLGEALKASDAEDLKKKTMTLLQENKDLKRRCGDLMKKHWLAELSQWMDQAVDLPGAILVTGYLKEVEARILRVLADAVLERRPEAVVILGSSDETTDKTVTIAAIGPKAQQQGFRAQDILTVLEHMAHVRGGGRGRIVQAGGRDPEALRRCLNDPKRLAQELLQPMKEQET